MRTIKRLATILVAIALIAAVAPAASAAPPTRKLTIAKNGTGTGTVTSSPAGLNCGATCQASFTTGSTVTLTATPTAGSAFTGWAGGGCSGTGLCNVTMNSQITVTATFNVTNYSLTVSKAGTGAGTVTSAPAGISCGVTCTANYAPSTAVTLTAVASAGSTFTGWSGGGCSGTGTCGVTMNSAISVTATFTINSYALTVSKNGTGTGTVTSAPAGIACGATCNANFNHGTVVTLVAAPSGNSSFTGWSGGGCSGTGSCDVTMTSANAVVATFTLATYDLTVSKTGIGSGTVTSNVGGINCGGTCSANYNAGSAVILTAAPDAGSAFTGWSGGGCSGTGTCNVTMNGATTVSAAFGLTDKSVTVSKAGTGTGTVASVPSGIACGATCVMAFPGGSNVGLVATPDASSTFAGWSDACSGTGLCSLSMDANKAVTATFTLIPRTLTVAKSGVGTGTVTSAPAGITCGAMCNANFAHGTIVTLSAVADGGSTFAGWTGACTGVGDCLVSMDQAQGVTATFVLIPRTLTVSKSGTGAGTVTSSPAGLDCGPTCARIFNDGTSVTLTATPSAGSTFTGWSGSGCGGTGTCITAMTADRAVTATFTIQTRTVTVTKSGAGSGVISSSPVGIDCGATCNTSYDYGTLVVLSVVPDGGSTFAGWTGACAAYGVGPCTLTVDGNLTAGASFVLIPRTLTVATTGAGNGSVASNPAGIDCGPACAFIYQDGTSVTLTATPDANSTFSGWSGAGCSGTGTCTTIMSANRAVTASFVPSTRTLTVVKDGGGTGTIGSVPGGIDCGATCASTFNSGSGVVLVAIPDPGSVLLGWNGGGCSGTGLCAVTMNADTTVTATFAGPRQPDGAVKKSKSASFTGEGILNSTGAGQTVLSKVKRGKTTVFNIKVTNVGTQADSFTLDANKGNQKPFQVKYAVSGTDVTAAVIGGTYTTPSLGVGESTVLTATVKASRRAKIGATKTWLLLSSSVVAPAEQDTIGFTAKARK